VQKDLKLNSVFFFSCFLIFFLYPSFYFSQSDSVFFRNGSVKPCNIVEISEKIVLYIAKGSEEKVKLGTDSIYKIKFKNGYIEKFDTLTSNNPIAKKTEPKTQELDKEKIEKISYEFCKKLTLCAIKDVFNNSFFIDWSVTRKDVFHPDVIIVSVKVLYERMLTDREYYTGNIKIKNYEGVEEFDFLNASIETDGYEIIKCQKKILKQAK